MHKKFKIEIAVVILLYAIFGIISLVSLNPHIDERESHLPTVKTFYDNGILNAIESDGYKSASTPLPYIIVSTPLKIFNIEPALFSVRLSNIIISLAAILIFTLIIKPGTKDFIYPLLILFFYPYYLKPSFAFFMSIYGLVFFLLFIYLIERMSAGYILTAGLSLAAAVLCQQFYLIVFVFIVSYKLYREFFIDDASKRVLNLVYFLLPFILPLIVFLLWGGLTHPNYRSWGTGFSFINLTGVLVTLGAALLPYMVFNIKKIKVQILVMLLLLSVLLVVFAFPVWVNQPTVGGISGITFNFLAKVDSINSLLSIVFKTIFCFMGMSSFLLFFKKAINNYDWLLLFLFVVLAIGFSLNKLPSERHMLPLIAVGYLFVFNHSVKKNVLRYWLAYSIIIGSVYFYYIMFAYRIQ